MPLDLKIKSKLVADLLTLTGVVAHDPLLLRFQRKRAASGIASNSNKTKQHSEASSSPGRNGSKKTPKQQAQISADESKIAQMVQDEMDRCGDFLRIFPTANTWELYGEYFSERQNFTVVVHKFLYPSVSKFVFSSVYRGKALCKNLKSQEQTHQLPKKLEMAKKLMSAALAKALTSENMVAKDSGEEMATSSKGFNSKFNSLDACSIESEGSDENPVIRLLKMDETLSQVQARRVFALYLHKVGERLRVIMKNENLEADAQSAQNFKQQLDLVLQFLNYASENLLYSVDILSPEDDAGIYDQGKFLLTQLTKFLDSYNKETERMAQAIGQDDREYFVPRELFDKFVESAKAFELEEVLMIVAEHHSTSWFLGTRVRNSNWCSSRSNAVVDTAELGLSNLRNFHYFFPPKSLSVPDCAEVTEQRSPLTSAQLPHHRRSSAANAPQNVPAEHSLQHSNAVAHNKNNCHCGNGYSNHSTTSGKENNKMAMATASDRYSASFRSLAEADYLIGEFRRVKSSLYRAARIYTSKHTL